MTEKGLAQKHGVVSELKLMGLQTLIKLIKETAKNKHQPMLVTKMETVLSKFDLAVFKEVKYRDYRSAFNQN